MQEKSIRELTEMMMDIADAVSEIHGNCNVCPLRDVTTNPVDCPFEVCPEMWEF